MFPSQLYPLREGEESQPGRAGIAGLRLSQGHEVFTYHIFESLCFTISCHLGPQISSYDWEAKKTHQVENSILPCNRARATVPPPRLASSPAELVSVSLGLPWSLPVSLVQHSTHTNPAAQGMQC